MYRILVVPKFLSFSSAWWAAPWPHESYLSHNESSFWSCSWASIFKQHQEVPVAEQWSSHFTAGVLSFSAADGAPYMSWQPDDWTGKKTQFGGRQRHPPNSWYLSFSKLDQEEVWDCSVLKAENVGCRKQARGGWRDHSLLLFGTLRVTKAWWPQEWLLLYSSDWGHAIQSYVLRPLDRCSDNPRVSRQSW